MDLGDAGPVSSKIDVFGTVWTSSTGWWGWLPPSSTLTAAYVRFVAYLLQIGWLKTENSHNFQLLSPADQTVPFLNSWQNIQGSRSNLGGSNTNRLTISHISWCVFLFFCDKKAPYIWLFFPKSVPPRGPEGFSIPQFNGGDPHLINKKHFTGNGLTIAEIDHHWIYFFLQNFLGKIFVAKSGCISMKKNILP